MAGCKPNCCTQPRAAPWVNDVALIKVSRSEMSCKRGQSSLLGLPSAADIMKRATCFMRGNAPCGVKGFNGLRAFGAWHFCAGAKMPNVSIAAYVSQGVALGYGQHWGLQPAPIIYRAFVQLVHLHAPFLDLFDCAQHSPNKFGSALA